METDHIISSDYWYNDGIGSQRTIDLSHREEQILMLAMEGLTDQAISHRLKISTATVNTYWGRIRSKLGPYSRPELVANYLRTQTERDLEVLRSENKQLLAELRRVDEKAKTQSQELSVIEALIQSAPDAILVCREDLSLALANEAACDLFGYKKPDWSKVKISDVVPAEHRSLHMEKVSDYISKPERKDMHGLSPVEAIRKDGSRIKVVVSLNSAHTSEGSLVIAIVRPARSPSALD